MDLPQRLIGAVWGASAITFAPEVAASDVEPPTTAANEAERSEVSASEFDFDSRPVEEESPFEPIAFAEVYYQWNFARPHNGITNFRAFDNRHDTFTLSNVALGAQWDDGRVLGRVVLQVGHTPSTYYASEPSQPATDGANASGPELWKFVQEAFVGYRLPWGVEVSAGLFLSPIGPESLPVHGNWNWSHSNLFFGLPFYHTGARVAVPLDEQWTATAGVFNGWNSVVDGNRQKSVSLQIAGEAIDGSAVSLLYFGGVERAAAEGVGRPWRHLFDAYGTWHTTRWLALRLHGNAGFEPHPSGTSRWFAGAASGRVELGSGCFLAARADLFHETSASGVPRIFWPATWVASGTVTGEYRPTDHVSLRLEYRRDQAATDMYFGARATGEPPLPSRDFQDTVTAGLTSWL